MVDKECGQIMAEWSKEKQEKVVKTVLDRSLNDAQFRKELVSHPHRAIQEATGEIVPDSVRLQFIDQSAAHLTVVLPAMKVSEDELSEQQLETVAGGKGGVSQGQFLSGLGDIGDVLNTIASPLGVFTGTAVGTAAHTAE